MRMNFLSRWVVGACALLAAGVAQANTISLVYTGASSVGPNIRFNYDVYLTGGSLKPAGVSPTGNAIAEGMTLLNVDGYVPGSALYSPVLAGAAFNVTESPTFTYNSTMQIVETLAPNPLINVSITYAGLGTITESTQTALLLGNFSIVSTLKKITATQTYAVGSTDESIVTSGPQQGETNTFGPSQNGPDVITPLPLAACGGIGLIGLIAARRRRSLQV